MGPHRSDQQKICVRAHVFGNHGEGAQEAPRQGRVGTISCLYGANLGLSGTLDQA